MRLAISGPATDEVLAFGRQIGATDYVGGDAGLSRERGYYGFQELMIVRNRVEDAGLKWTVSGIPEEWTNKIKLGLPGRDEQITSWCKTIENMGAAGVPVICYFFSLRSSIGHYGLRTSRSTPGRGGAKVTSFDHDQIRSATQDFWDPPVARSLEVTDQQVWDNVTWFLERVIPVAEDAGVKLALHPDDPPVSPIGGVARVFRDHAALRRVVDIVPSDSNGLTFCQGTISEMPEDVFDAIRYFGTRNKIHHVHFRNVTGTVPTFSETFIDEGHVDMVKAMKAYRDTGFDGPMVEDHVPEMAGGPDQWPAKAFALGYMKAVMQAANAS
jgi:mannonate dehydratase